jgi:hypothetical protein
MENTTVDYVIRFDSFVGDGDTTGYLAWDYFDAEVPSEFKSQAEAEEWIKTHHCGPDCAGVTATFYVDTESR